jgi:pyruvate formate-lyase activating enzyme-like uncharacterized protein
MVLFVTGLCDSTCYYCPLSKEKAGQDVIFADEMPVNSDKDILYESKAIGAEGAGLSGGDPLCQLDRTLNFISIMKNRMGSDFHIHLYTSQTGLDSGILSKLENSGLDEIRFHPQSSDWSGIEAAVGTKMDVGIEVPAIPGKESRIKDMIKRANDIGASFFNINELEASESNFEHLVALGMRLTSLESASIKGSCNAAKAVLHWAADSVDGISIHYCSARYKDAVQMTKRLERRLVRTIREFEVRDDSEPLLVLGIIRAPHGDTLSQAQLTEIQQVLKTDFDVPTDLMNIDALRMRIEIAPWILDEITNDLRLRVPYGQSLEIGIASEYPSWDRLQTIFNPL